MTVRLIDGNDLAFSEMAIGELHVADDDRCPHEDYELNAFAFENGATHLSVETGYLYKVHSDCYSVSFFKRDPAGAIREIPSGYEAFEIDQCGFIPIGEFGASMDRALRSIPNYWKMTGAHLGAIVLCGLPATGKSWLCSELNNRGMKNIESYGLYGLRADQIKKARAVIKEGLAYHDSKKLGHLIFSTPSLELAKALEDYEQVFYIEGSPLKTIRKSLNQ